MCNTHYSARAGHETGHKLAGPLTDPALSARTSRFFSSFYLIIIYIYACIIYSYMCICVQQDRNHRNKHDNGEIRERDSLCVCVKLSRAQSVQSQCVLHGQPTAASAVGKNPPWSVPARAGHLLHECYNDKAVTNKLLQLCFGEGCFSPAVGTGSG